mgnify:CR=1 FL=1
MYKILEINSLLNNKSNWLSIILLLTSFGLLIPGIFFPMLSMSAQYGGKELFSYKQSITEAIETLWNGGNLLVAFLIALFSIAVPLLKGFFMLWVFFLGSFNFKKKAHSFVFTIGKWSMADVFAVGVFISYLAGKASSNLDAVLEPGFYYFTGYCIISLSSLQTMKLIKP